jgi:phosphoenolpyruvate carboxykinase (ATP)
VPQAVPGVPPRVLRPRESWRNPGDYDAKAAQLADMFVANFEKHAAGLADEVKAAGPRPVPTGR